MVVGVRGCGGGWCWVMGDGWCHVLSGLVVSGGGGWYWLVVVGDEVWVVFMVAVIEVVSGVGDVYMVASFVVVVLVSGGYATYAGRWRWVMLRR